MKPANAKYNFENFIKKSKFSFDELTLAYGIDLMFDFYGQIRADNCPVNKNGDMLLYEWGNYDWGKGMYFQCSITRQFIEAGFEGDDGMSQLIMCFYFYPPDGFEELKRGERWCDTPSDLSSFKAYIKESAAYIKVASIKPTKVEIRYSKI